MPTLRRPGLLVMDVDSTLIDEEVIDELGRAAGLGERIAAVTARAMNGELDFAQTLTERVALLRGLPLSVFDDVYASLHFTTGALKLIDTLHRHGWKVGVVSGGFHEIVDRLAEDADLDYRLANRLGRDEATRTLDGTLDGPIITKDVKLAHLHSWAEANRIPMAQTVAVGDGANDLPMIEAAGMGIAFCAKPAVKAVAPHAIEERNLMRVLDFILE